MQKLSVVGSDGGERMLRIVIRLGVKDLLYLAALLLIFGMIGLSLAFSRNREKSQSSNPGNPQTGNESSSS